MKTVLGYACSTRIDDFILPRQNRAPCDGIQKVLCELALPVMLLLTGCSRKAAGGAAAAPTGGGGRGGGPVPVTTAPVVQRDAVNVRAVGNVEPSTTVDIRAQVTGALLASASPKVRT